MKRAIVTATTVLSLVLAFTAQARGIDVDKVNGSIHIEGDQQAGELSTVNGGIRVDSGGSAQKVSTVNGGIDLGDHVTVDAKVGWREGDEEFTWPPILFESSRQTAP